MPLEAIQLLSALVIVTLGSALQSVVGIGFALVAAPLLFLVNPLYVPGPILTLGFALTLLVTLSQGHVRGFERVALAISGRIPGSLIGILLLTIVPPPLFAIGFGLMIMLCVLLTYRTLEVSLTGRNLVVAGLFSGLMGTTTSVGGPAIALVYQNSDRTLARNELSLFFLVGTLVSIVLLTVYGRYGMPELQRSLELMPAVFCGYLLGKRLEYKLKEISLKTVLAVISLASSALIIGRGILAI